LNVAAKQMKPKNNCDAKFVYVVCQIDSIKVVNHDLIIYDADESDYKLQYQPGI
jgi:hypothetical protein